MATQDQVIFKCKQSLTIKEIHQHHAVFQDWLENRIPLIIFEGKSLEKIDTASLQLLLCFIKTGEQNGMHFQWESPSPTLLRNAKLLGLKELLKLP